MHVMDVIVVQFMVADFVRRELTMFGLKNECSLKLEEEYKTITTLQPKVRYYWETGSWHLAYNAYADYADKPGIPEARRRPSSSGAGSSPTAS